MKKAERIALLQKEYENTFNDTNIFTKGLKADVTLEQFKDAFAQFGEITSCAIRKASLPMIKTQFGFACFKDRPTCFKCLVGGPNNQAIQALYEEKVYLNLAMPKSRYDQFKKNKQMHILNYLKSKRMPYMEPKIL